MSSERGEGTPTGSEEEEFGEPDGAALAPAPAGEADEAESGIPKIPDWAEELLASLAAGERVDARDQSRLTYALDLRKEYVAACQQRKAERAAATLQQQQAEAAAVRQAKEAETKAAENATLLAVIEKQDKRLEALTSRLAAVEAGNTEDLEPSFREFCPRAKENPFGGPTDLRGRIERGLQDGGRRAGPSHDMSDMDGRALRASAITPDGRHPGRTAR